jgi:hypothetical protein
MATSLIGAPDLSPSATPGRRRACGVMMPVLARCRRVLLLDSNANIDGGGTQDHDPASILLRADEVIQ